MSDFLNSQSQENENVFDELIDEEGIFDKGKFEKYLEVHVGSDGEFSLLQSLLSIKWFSTTYLLLFLIFINVIRLLIAGDGNFYLYLVFFLACILGLIGFIVIPLIHTSTSIQGRYIEKINDTINNIRKQLLNELTVQCKACVQTKMKNDLNAYNLYTYDQILQMEQSLLGVDSAVYCYSRYRDDGGVGPHEADEVVDYNLSKGIKYYYVYYENPPGAKEPIERDGEVFIDLSKKKKEVYKECLDYRIYKEARFDVMIYQWNESHIEGYFCLNFPIGNCQNCDKSEAERCPLKSTNDKPDKLLYKKMPQEITMQLYKKLIDLVDESKK